MFSTSRGPVVLLKFVLFTGIYFSPSSLHLQWSSNICVGGSLHGTKDTQNSRNAGAAARDLTTRFCLIPQMGPNTTRRGNFSIHQCWYYRFGTTALVLPFCESVQYYYYYYYFVPL